MPPTMKETFVQRLLTNLTFLCLGVWSCIIADIIWGSEGAGRGPWLVLGVVALIFLGSLVVTLYRHRQSLGWTTELEMVWPNVRSEVMLSALLNAFMWVVSATLIAVFVADWQSLKSITEAVRGAGEKQPIVFWGILAGGVVIGAISGYRTMRLALGRIHGQSERSSDTHDGAPPKGGV